MRHSTEISPSLSPKILTDERELLERIVHKWLQFQTNMWNQVNISKEKEIRTYSHGALVFRILIIILSASVTVIADIDEITRTTVTFVAGFLTTLTGIEAFLKFGERQLDARKQQREIEALRDQLRFDWFVNVEVENDFKKRLAAGKELLEKGPDSYNELLNKYVLKAESREAPQANI